MFILPWLENCAKPVSKWLSVRTKLSLWLDRGKRFQSRMTYRMHDIIDKSILQICAEGGASTSSSFVRPSEERWLDRRVWGERKRTWKGTVVWSTVVELFVAEIPPIITWKNCVSRREAITLAVQSKTPFQRDSYGRKKEKKTSIMSLRFDLPGEDYGNETFVLS